MRKGGLVAGDGISRVRGLVRGAVVAVAAPKHVIQKRIKAVIINVF